MILRAYEALIAEGERSPAFPICCLARAEQTARRSAELFAERHSGRRSPPSNSRRCAQRILRFSETIAQGPAECGGQAA